MIDIRTFKGDKGGDWLFPLVLVSALLSVLYIAYLIVKWTLNILIICVAWLVAPLFDKDKNKNK